LDPAIILRAYQVRDRPQVRALACDTAARGEPVEEFFHDRELFADALTTYYTDWEPQALWVAEYNGQVVGYLTGCLDDRRYRRLMVRRILPRLILRALGRGAFLHPNTWRLAAAAWRTWRLGRRRHRDRETYPAHLHVNLQQGFRGRRIGERLVQRFLQQAVAAGVPGVRAAVRSDNAAAGRFFARLGFVEISRVSVVFPSDRRLKRRDTIVYGRRV